MKEECLKILNSDVPDNLILKFERSCVVCAVRGKSWEIYTGVNIAWWHSFCAEPAAVSSALAHGETEITHCVALKKHKRTKEITLISPCGICREMFNESFKSAKFFVMEDGKVKLKISLQSASKSNLSPARAFFKLQFLQCEGQLPLNMNMLKAADLKNRLYAHKHKFLRFQFS